MNTSSKYRRLGIVAEMALAAMMLFTLWSCGDDTSPDPTPPDTTLVEPPDTTLVEPPDTTLAEPPDTTLAEAPGAPPVAVSPPMAVSPRPRIREVFCELCKDELENGLILEQLNDYQGQCGLCKATEVKTTTASRIDRAAGGYTLIVLSSTRRLEAEAAAERFRRRFSTLPVDVLVGELDGVSRYRVGLGQVATVAAAVALRNRLAADLPPDTWVTRIR
ncbi:MAG: SPOR domain-containing protein [Rhodothermales bacterium]